MSDIINQLLKNVDVKQVNELLGKLSRGKDGEDKAPDKETVGKIAGKLGADPSKLMELLPGILKKTEGKLDVKSLLGSIDIKELAKLLPDAGLIAAAHTVSKVVASKLDAETEKIREVESTLWKGSASTEITRAADKAAEYSRTEVSDIPTADDIKVLKMYRELAQKAKDTAAARKETLLKCGTDKYSDPVAEMNSAIIKASQAVRTLDEKIEAAEKCK